jgi:hypothetical protein
MAVSAKPTRLRFASATSAAYTTVADVIDISGPNPQRDDQIDVTSIQSTAAYRTYLPGPFIDPGEMTFNIFYNPTVASHSTAATGLAGLFVAGSTVVWRVQIAGASSGQNIQFNGYISSFEPSMTVGEAVQASLTVRLTGAVNWP